MNCLPGHCMMIDVTNIQRFATHDGPGIRTTIFLKGCPLHCPWCANPETQSQHQELFYDQRRCTHCLTCVSNCPTQALTFRGDHLDYNWQRCQHCLKCVDNCLNDAISFQSHMMDVDSIMEPVLSDVEYYKESNGGMTISGGEPFVQFEGVLELLKSAKTKKIDTAVETTGNYAQDLLKQAYPYVDHYLYDFKHLDDAVLKEITGGDGTLIKENLKYLLSRDPDKVNVRIPIIPGFNYDHELLIKTIDYLDSIGVRKINLLPYHTLGKVKYEKLGWDYKAPAKMLDKKGLEEYHRYILDSGMESKIGA